MSSSRVRINGPDAAVKVEENESGDGGCICEGVPASYPFGTVAAGRSLRLSGLKILVVDDKLDTREFVSFVLEQLWYGTPRWLHWQKNRRWPWQKHAPHHEIIFGHR